MNAPKKQKKYNLLYIHSDQHTPYVTGCYGDSIVQTPNLDKLASKGVKFTNAYCPSPICTPSRMSTFTGKFPYRNESWNNYHVLDSGYPTFAHSMGAAGYRPVLFGRMHSIGPDQLRGYAERYVGDHCSNFTESSDVDHGELTGTTGPNRISLVKSGAGQNAYQVHDEDVLEEVLTYIDNLGEKKTSDDDSPFNLSIGLMLPHQPYVARKEDYELYEGKIPMPSVMDEYNDDLHPYYKQWRKERKIEHVSDEEILRSKTAYYALVTAMDRMIGDIFDQLDKNGLLENTLIVYSSDHGEQIGEHSLWWKQTFYEYSVKIPMILSLPGVLPEGETYDENVSSLDLNATMLDILGCPALPDSDGRSMLPIIDQKSWDNKVFSEYCTDDGTLMRMIKKDNWKLNYYHGMPCELFNLAEDPMEQTDLSKEPEFATIKQELLDEVLADWDPIKIAAKIAKMKAENDIISDWAYNVNPSDQFRWKLLPEMDYLEQRVF
ncbi:MAG: sulfatase-like hydrolase/transferase [Lentisphaerales bacterium]|nr:sulfatase-like hydrolase/transferase [Lentisphaerales bacterium]